MGGGAARQQVSGRTTRGPPAHKGLWSVCTRACRSAGYMRPILGLRQAPYPPTIGSARTIVLPTFGTACCNCMSGASAAVLPSLYSLHL